MKKITSFILTITFIFSLSVMTYARNEIISDENTDRVSSGASVEVTERHAKGSAFTKDHTPSFSSKEINLYSDTKPSYRGLLSEKGQQTYDIIVGNANPENIVYDENLGYNVLVISCDLYSVFGEDMYDRPDDVTSTIADAYTAISYDNPELHWLNNGPYFEWSSYIVDDVITDELRISTSAGKGPMINAQAQKQDTISKEEALRDIEIVNQWKEKTVKYISSIPDLYEKNQYMMRLLVDSTTYDTDDRMNGPYSHTAVGIPLNGFAVCQGYSNCYKLIFDELGIPCVLLYSDIHMWVATQMDDGLWYQTDATWQDGWWEEDGFLLLGENTIKKADAPLNIGSHDLLINPGCDFAADTYQKEPESTTENTAETTTNETQQSTFGSSETTNVSYALNYNDANADKVEGSGGVVLINDGTVTAAEPDVTDISISSVVGGSIVTEIGEHAFANAKNLEQIIIPASIKNIADNAFEGCEKLTIICAKGSAALQYAQSHGINYIISEYSLYKGDLNGDGSITRLDFILSGKYFAGNNVNVDEYALAVSGGEKVSRKDSISIAKFFAGRDVTFK